MMIVLTGLAGIAAAPPARAPDLGWLSGAWVSESKGEWVEELWTSPRGGMMLGTNRSGKGAKVTGFEFMRIAADQDGRPTFWASPSGKEAVPFRMFSSGPNQVAFENPANDYPTRIAYRRVGSTLHAAISGPGGKNTMTWTFRRPRVK
jgi:hypothetical protein